METIDIGYREVPFRVKDAAHILSTPELLEKISADTYDALLEFHTYCTQEGFGEDTGFRLTLTPGAHLDSALREVVRVLKLVKNGGCQPFDDSDMGTPSREASREASMQ